VTITDTLYEYHKVFLYLTTIGLAAYGIMAIITPEVLAAGFQRFTSQEWLQFEADSSSAAAYIILLWRLIGLFNLMAGIALTLIVWKWLQLEIRWSWIALFTGTILAYLGPMITDLTVGSIEAFEIIEFALFGIFVIVMLLVREIYWTVPEE
jgi:hypothetical protein